MNNNYGTFPETDQDYNLNYPIFKKDELLVNLPDHTIIDIAPSVVDISYLRAVKTLLSNYLPATICCGVDMINGPLAVWILTKHDPDLLATYSLIIPSHLLTIWIPATLLFAATPLINKAKGAAQVDSNLHSEVGSIVQSGIILSAGISIPVISALTFNENLLKFLGRNAQHAALSQAYFKYYRWSAPALMSVLTLQQLIVSQRHPLICASSFVLNSLVSNGLSYLFVNGKVASFIPRGVAGMGCANTIAAFTTFGSLATYLAIKKEFRKFQVFAFHDIRSLLKYSKEMIRLGCTSSISTGSEIITFSSISFLSGRLGDSQLAAHQIASLFSGVYANLASWLGQIGTGLVSHELGSAHPRNAIKYTQTTLATSLTMSMITAGTFSIFSRQLASLLVSPEATNSSMTIDLVRYLILLDAIGQPAGFLRNSMPFLLTSYNQLWLPLLLNILTFSGTTFGLSFLLGMGDENLYLSRSIGMYLSAMCMGVLLYRACTNFSVMEDSVLQEDSQISFEELSESESAMTASPIKGISYGIRKSVSCLFRHDIEMLANRNSDTALPTSSNSNHKRRFSI